MGEILHHFETTVATSRLKPWLLGISQGVKNQKPGVLKTARGMGFQPSGPLAFEIFLVRFEVVFPFLTHQK